MRIVSLFPGAMEIVCALGPGPRLVDSLEILAHALHPGLPAPVCVSD